MTIVNLTPPYQQFYDSNGDPLSGGLVYSYTAGTTTPLATYTDQGGGTPNANPVVLDSAGRADIWLDNASSYKFVVKTSTGTTIRTVDNVTPFNTAASITSVGTIVTGVWNAGAVTSSGAVTGTGFIPTGSSPPANGIFLPAASTVGISCNSVERARLTSTGLFVVCSSLPSSTVSGTLIGNPATSSANLSSAGATASSTPLWQFFNTNGQVGNITVAASATAFNTSSDKRLKENPVPIEDSGAIIDALGVFKFDWKTQGSGVGYGVFAQDAYEVFPSAVTPGNDVEPGHPNFSGWSVDYSKYVPLLLAEIQKLRERVAALEA